MQWTAEQIEQLGRAALAVLDVPGSAVAAPYDGEMWQVDFGAGGHPSRYEAVGPALVLTCPVSGAEVSRTEPAA